MLIGMLGPEAIYHSNHSRESLDRIAVWNSMYEQHLLVTSWICSDARFMVPVPVRTRVIRTIAAAGSSAPYEDLLLDERSMFNCLILHYDAGAFTVGQAPITCGGLVASQEIHENHIRVGEEGVLHFAEANINHPDPLIQALIRASAIAKRSGKWVLAAIQDHLTGTIIPFGLFKHESGTTIKITAVDPHYSYQNVYNPKEIYAKGIPSLSMETIVRFEPHIASYLQAHERERVTLLKRYPSLPSMLKVQQPKWLVITENSRPKEARFVGAFDYPGSSFGIRISRSRENVRGQKGTQITDRDRATAIDQAEYPISHAVQNYQEPAKPFYAFHGVYIEMSTLEASCAFAKQMMRRGWMKDFMAQDKDRSIIIGEEKHGLVADTIRYYQPE